MQRITIYPENELKNWIEETAKKKKKSVNKLLIDIIKLYKSKDEFRIGLFNKRDKKEIIRYIKKSTERRSNENGNNNE